jgi:hypothetical protein
METFGGREEISRKDAKSQKDGKGVVHGEVGDLRSAEGSLTQRREAAKDGEVREQGCFIDIARFDS